MKALTRCVLWCCGWACCLTWHAIAADSLNKSQLEIQKKLLQKERENVAVNFDTEARLCWQKFMVNDCLQEARLQRRQQLALIAKQEQALRVMQRELSVMERQERLDAKQPDLQVPYERQ